MNDLISRAAAIEALTNRNIERNVDSVYDGELHRARRAAQRVIAQLPAIDAVPVVRCGDCKYADTFADMTSVEMPLKCLNIRYGGVYPDWYCEHGERRDSE